MLRAPINFWPVIPVCTSDDDLRAVSNEAFLTQPKQRDIRARCLSGSPVKVRPPEDAHPLESVPGIGPKQLGLFAPLLDHGDNCLITNIAEILLQVPHLPLEPILNRCLK